MKNHLPILALWALTLTNSLPAEEPVSFRLTPEQIKNLQLTFGKVNKRILHQPVTGVGVIHLDENRVFDVAPRISGFVAEDLAQLGDTVTKGQKLFTIQSAELSEMVNDYVKAEQAMNFASAAAVQEERLADKGLSSKEQVRIKQLELQQAVAAHARALQPLKLLDFDEATVHQYLANVEGSDYTSYTVISLGSGEIIQKELRLGAVVDPNASLFTVADLSELWVDFSVSLRDVDRLEKGHPVQVESSISHETRTATTIYIAPLADDQNRMVKVRAILENKDRAWRPGTPVLVKSEAADTGEKSVLSVPTSAVVDYGYGKAVFRTDGNGTFTLTPIEIVTGDESITEITSRINAGEEVVIRNAAQLKGHLEMTASE